MARDGRTKSILPITIPPIGQSGIAMFAPNPTHEDQGGIPARPTQTDEANFVYRPIRPQNNEARFTRPPCSHSLPRVLRLKSDHPTGLRRVIPAFGLPIFALQIMREMIFAEIRGKPGRDEERFAGKNSKLE
ncbi:hypothetical protein [Methylocapsa palsarum]|uniref:hypothetical protein n=1 Tax=Methylocapsa palsarum TaxID=1612308 RepID=UPI0011133B98|nr:hypothetical protein [Methylocapsa palsarum]